VEGSLRRLRERNGFGTRQFHARYVYPAQREARVPLPDGIRRSIPVIR